MTASYRIMLCYPNHLYATAATLSGGSWSATAGLANLQDGYLESTARSVDCDPANTQFTADLGDLYPCSALGFWNDNLSIDGLFRWDASQVSDFSAVECDSGWVDRWPVGQYINVPWEDPHWWDGRATAKERIRKPRQKLWLPPATAVIRYLRLRLDDQANAEGFLELGLAGAFAGFQPSYNKSWRSQLGVVDNSIIVTSLGQADHFDRKHPRRTQRLELNYLTTDESLMNCLELMLDAGVVEDVLYIDRPEDPTHINRRSFLCRMQKLNPIESAYLNNDSLAFDLIEKVA